MKSRSSMGLVALMTASLLFASGAAMAVTDAAKAPHPEKAKPAAAAKLVDINSASKDDLKKLPGITDADADKIVAGRPYLSKYFLVSDKVISEALFHSIKKQIIAQQPPHKKPAPKAKQ